MASAMGAIRVSPYFTLAVLIFAVGIVFTSATTDSKDVSALQGIFTNLNNPQQLTGWTSGGQPDPCTESWKGVVCSGSSVTSLQLSGLGLTGSLYYQLSDLVSLQSLDMSNNQISSNIPYGLPPNVQQLNLANNQLSGNMPYSISAMANLTSLKLNNNQLSGQIQDVFGKLQNLTTMDLSNNKLTDNLPSSFSSLSSLTSLSLQNNQLTGPVDVLASLPLTQLNIENNHFSGWVPSQWKSKSNFLYSGNSFTASPAPPPPPYTPPPPGAPKRKPSGGSPPSDTKKSSGSKSNSLSAGAIAGIIIAVVLAIVAATLAFICARKPGKSRDEEKLNIGTPFSALGDDGNCKSISSLSAAPKVIESVKEQKFKPSVPETLKSPIPVQATAVGAISAPVRKKQPISATAFSIADLQMATNSFSQDNIIGEGALGHVYRAEFPDGKILAVKKLDTSVLPIQNAEDFLEAISLMSSLHQPYITELVGYCAEHGHYLILYEYFDNGSLYDMLHLMDDSVKPLSWNQRVKIALNTARALEYLHQECSPPVMHKNLKCANILIDDELSPHLADCGLSSLNPQGSYQVVDSFGYSAPEYTMKGLYMLESDVYSFGVVMLELLTGRKPLDSSRPRAEQSLVRWASPRLHDIDALTKMIDPVLKEVYPAKSLSRFADIIVKCIQPEPEFRPQMSEVVQDLMRMIQKTSLNKRMVADELGPSYNAPDEDFSY